MKKHRLPAAVLALAALGFTLGTCEFVIVGILPDIAAGLNVSLAAVGRLVSVFGACPDRTDGPLPPADRADASVSGCECPEYAGSRRGGAVCIPCSGGAGVRDPHRSGYAVCEGGFFPGTDGPGHFRRVRGLFRGGGGGGAHRYSGVPRSWLAGHLWRDPGNGTGAAACAGPAVAAGDRCPSGRGRPAEPVRGAAGQSLLALCSDGAVQRFRYLYGLHLSDANADRYAGPAGDGGLSGPAGPAICFPDALRKKAV